MNGKDAVTHEEKYHKDGSLESFTTISDNGTNRPDVTIKNNKGEIIWYQSGNGDGTYKTGEKEEKGWNYHTYDKNDRMIEARYAWAPGNKYQYTYNSDGTISELTTKYGTPITYEVKDKNDRLIRKKDFDDKGVVKYTVTPKYDKDCCVIKNDTVWNEERNK